MSLCQTSAHFAALKKDMLRSVIVQTASALAQATGSSNVIVDAVCLFDHRMTDDYDFVDATASVAYHIFSLQEPTHFNESKNIKDSLDMLVFDVRYDNATHICKYEEFLSQLKRSLRSFYRVC